MLPEDSQQAIASLQDQLKAKLSFADVRASWVKAGNFHITLEFLQSISDEQVTRLSQCLDRTKLIAPFEIVLDGLEWFPSERRPRVCALSVARGADALQKLSTVLKSQLAALGFTASAQAFHPHVTLARIKAFQSNPVTAMSATAQTLGVGPFVCSQVVLVKSTLTASGPQYAALASWPLS